MYKILTTLLAIVLLPLLVFAQDDNVVKEFAKRALELHSIQINEHLNVLQIEYDKATFELIGVNDQMQTIWRSTFKGHPFQTAKFKGNIITLTSTEDDSKGPNNTFVAFLVDYTTGKLIAQNQICTDEDDYREFPEMSTGDGSYCEVVIRKGLMERKRSYSAFGFSKKLQAQKTISNLQAFELNEKLEIVNSFKPEIDPGLFLTSAFNNNGDIFISWLDGVTINVYRYPKEKPASSKKLSIDIPAESIEIEQNDDHHIMNLIPDEKDKNKVYYAVIYKNKNKNPELNVGKFDFINGKETSATEEFDKKEVKRLKKSYVGVNKKIDDADFSSDQIELKYASEMNGKLVVALGSYSKYSSTTIYPNANVSTSGSTTADYATLINGYDLDLNQKFQQLMPIKSANPFIKLYNGYYITNDKLNILSNYTSSMMNGHYQALSVLDLNTGTWDKMDILSKKHINNGDFADGRGVMWFGTNYIVPYCNPKSWVNYYMFEVTLQQNQY
jgi:hypothetical protein